MSCDATQEVNSLPPGTVVRERLKHHDLVCRLVLLTKQVFADNLLIYA